MLTDIPVVALKLVRGSSVVKGLNVVEVRRVDTVQRGSHGTMMDHQAIGCSTFPTLKRLKFVMAVLH